MRELPILFSAPMIRAILDGRKTVTRRVVKPQPSEGFGYLHPTEFDPGVRCWTGFVPTPRMLVGTWTERKAPYRVGDRLWVRERFKPIASGQVKNGYGEVRYGYAYEADGASRWNERPTIIHDLTGQPNKGPMQFRPSPWRAAVTMPYRAARIWLEVTAVRVERLQDISEAQAHAEGIGGEALFRAQGWAPLAFERLWESINGTGSWAANPWVWVVEFKRIEKEVPDGGS